MDDKEFIEGVQNGMEEIKSNRGINNTYDLFAIWFGKYILRYEEDQVAEIYHIGGAGDEKIDLGIVDDEEEIIFIVQAKYSQNPISSTFNRDDVEEVNTAIRRLDNEPNIGNQKRIDFASLYNSKKTKYITRPIFVCFGKLTSDAIGYANANRIKIYDYRRLKTDYERYDNPASFTAPNIIRLSPDTCVEFRDTLLLVLNVKEIYDCFDQYGPGLLDENLRYKLASSKKWNIAEKIRKTLSDSPNQFVYLNNGITMVSENFEINQKKNNIVLYEPQIVNGCQTVYAIYDTLTDTEIDNAFIIVKVVKTEEPDVRRKIAYAANYQYPITPRDLKSNDPFQIEIQRSFSEKRVFYERKRGEWDTIIMVSRQGGFRVSRDQYRLIDNELCGQLYLSLAGLPALAKNKKEVIFDDTDYYETIFKYDSRDWARIGLELATVKLRDGIDAFVDDVLFAYGIYRLTEFVGHYLFKKKKDMFSDEKDEVYGEVLKKEFLTGYWNFYVVKIFHNIVEHYAQGNEDRRYELRSRLIGDYLNNIDDLSKFFITNKEISQYFSLDTDLREADILDPAEPSSGYPLFGKWFSSLEQIVYEKVRKEMDKVDWKSFNYYFHKKAETLNDILNLITPILVSSRRRASDFPDHT